LLFDKAPASIILFKHKCITLQNGSKDNYCNTISNNRNTLKGFTYR